MCQSDHVISSFEPYGNDNAGTGSDGNPWGSIAHAVSTPGVGSGDRILVWPGNYTQKDSWIQNSSNKGIQGTASNPVIVIEDNVIENLWNSKATEAEVTVSDPGTFTQLMQTGLSVEAGTRMAATFEMKLDIGTSDMQVFLLQDAESFKMLSLNQTFSVTEQWQQYTFAFTPTLTESNARFRWRFTDDEIGRTVSIRNVCLGRASTIAASFAMDTNGGDVPITVSLQTPARRISVSRHGSGRLAMARQAQASILCIFMTRLAHSQFR